MIEEISRVESYFNKGYKLGRKEMKAEIIEILNKTDILFIGCDKIGCTYCRERERMLEWIFKQLEEKEQ